MPFWFLRCNKLDAGFLKNTRQYRHFTFSPSKTLFFLADFYFFFQDLNVKVKLSSYQFTLSVLKILRMFEETRLN